MAERQNRLRMDFVMKVLSFDEESGKLTFKLEPDPRRYEWTELDGEPGLYDRLDKAFFPKKVFFESMKQMEGLPIYHQPQRIENADAYIESRISQIVQRLEGNEETPRFEDKSEQFLQSLECDRLEFVIASVDIVGSTHLATTLPQAKYARLIGTVLSELAEVVPKFRGHVLKYTGDGLIAYFPSPSFITMNDLALDCALTMRQLVHNAINPLLKRMNFPVIDIRIGLDSGEAYVVTVGSSETKKHLDVIGGIVSLACKIQAIAKPGEICMGETTERNLHVAWRQLCEPVNCGANWSYKEPNGELYRIFRFKVTY